MLRQSAESIIQSHEQMQARSKILSSHSTTVGRKNYERRTPLIRTEFVNFCHQRDNPKDQNKQVTVEEKKKRKEMREIEKSDEKERRRRAEELIQKEREERSRSRTLGKRCKVLPNDRFQLQKTILREVFNDVYSDFPHG